MTDQPTRTTADGSVEAVRFPDLDETALKVHAVNLRCELFQVIGEISRRGYFGETSVIEIEDTLIGAIVECIGIGRFSGEYETEHDVLDDLITTGQLSKMSDEAMDAYIAALADDDLFADPEVADALTKALNSIFGPCGDPDCCSDSDVTIDVGPDVTIAEENA